MSRPSSLPRWGLSLLLVLAVHVGVALWSLLWRAQPTPPPVAPPPAMLVELAPAPAAAPAAAAAPPPPAPAPPPEPEPVAPPKLAEAPKPKLAVPPPPPKPRPQPPKPQPKPEPRPAEPPTPAPTVASAPAAAPASAAPSAKPAAQPAASGSPAPSSAAPNWQGILLGHLNRYKRYPEEARRRGQQGVVKLRFVLDGQGKVLSFELAAPSGSAALDRATLEMIQRAQPLPPPPAELLQGGRLEVVAPFVYSLERR